jgi:hypothetical protein
MTSERYGDERARIVMLNRQDLHRLEGRARGNAAAAMRANAGLKARPDDGLVAGAGETRTDRGVFKRALVEQGAVCLG